MTTHIGNRALDLGTLERVQEALATRGLTFGGFERGPDGHPVAIAINGHKILARHLGRDERDAALRLSTMVTRP